MPPCTRLADIKVEHCAPKKQHALMFELIAKWFQPNQFDHTSIKCNCLSRSMASPSTQEEAVAIICKYNHHGVSIPANYCTRSRSAAPQPAQQAF